MGSKKIIVVGTRKSLLALTQTKTVVAQLARLFPEYRFVLKKIITSGDRLKQWPENQGKGLFVKEIEEALLSGRIDMAVHSMKDLPVDLPEALEIAAVPRRLNPADVFISRDNTPLAALKKGSRVGTSSPRRKTQLQAYRPDLRVCDIRGNLDTRLRKMESGLYDAIILAASGVQRLGWERRITEYIPLTLICPAPAQGALGIEVRRDDRRMRAVVGKIDHRYSRIAVIAEREFLKAMGGGCRVPIAAFAAVRGAKLRLMGRVAFRGNQAVTSRVSGSAKNPAQAGRKLARQVRAGIRRRIQKQRISKKVSKYAR